ncbi:MAG: ferrous iron transport protein B [Chitinophagales bacterium]
MAERIKKIALLGNPNAGKSSLFNHLTGLRQKVGNFPGVTVERKSGLTKLNPNEEVQIIDLPGTYSLYPTSLDERIAVNALIDTNNKDYPDAIIYILDITHLERHLLLLTQLMDLHFPIVVACNMNDIAEQQNIVFDDKKLEKTLGLKCIKINGRTGAGIEQIKDSMSAILKENSTLTSTSFFPITEKEKDVATELQKIIPARNDYHALQLVHHAKKSTFLSQENKIAIEKIIEQNNFNSIDAQLNEIMQRYELFSPIVRDVLRKSFAKAKSITDKIDAVVTNKYLGPIIFFGLMLFVFQAIFAWSTIPMDWIDNKFTALSMLIKSILPENILSRLLVEGIIPGIGGIVIFVPQITILFLLITLLEEIGYMSRAVYMFDNIMQKFGLNGRSIVALISGGACAIPAIMSTRTISNQKERLITILVTPFISCSARIPVFAVLIGFIVPSYKIGIFNSQGLVFMALYLIGIIAALTAAYIFKKILKAKESSYLMLELPEYKMPHWKNVFYTLNDKVSSFVFGAGKVILLVSLVLWFLASFGPPKKMKEAVAVATIESSLMQYDSATTNLHIASKKLEASYAGILGHIIEPVIKPLGFDWKIGIALITSFAAREVFVGTISTLYSIGKDADNLTIKEKLKQEKNAAGEPVFSMPVALSLVLFYLFAMQCMSTLATVHRETKTWKWPIIQFLYMSGTAYIVSMFVYQILK